MDFLEIIPSKDVKEYILKHQIEVSDVDYATLIDCIYCKSIEKNKLFEE